MTATPARQRWNAAAEHPCAHLTTATARQRTADSSDRTQSVGADTDDGLRSASASGRDAIASWATSLRHATSQWRLRDRCLGAKLVGQSVRPDCVERVLATSVPIRMSWQTCRPASASRRLAKARAEITACWTAGSTGAAARSLAVAATVRDASARQVPGPRQHRYRTAAPDAVAGRTRPNDQCARRTNQTRTDTA